MGNFMFRIFPVHILWNHAKSITFSGTLNAVMLRHETWSVEETCLQWQLQRLTSLEIQLNVCSRKLTSYLLPMFELCTKCVSTSMLFFSAYGNESAMHPGNILLSPTIGPGAWTRSTNATLLPTLHSYYILVINPITSETRHHSLGLLLVFES